MKRWLLTALILPAVVLPAGGQVDFLEGLPPELLLARAAAYARRFEQAMATVVLEERYVQVVKPWTGPPKEPDEAHLAWVEDLSNLQPDVIVKERRQIRSDLLLAQLPDRTWAAFRDTFEVNGRPRHNRDDRLRELFLQQTEDSRRQLHRINEASAEWNLGGFYRDLNLPTTVLFLIHPRNQQRFRFRAADVRGVAAEACRLVTFTEQSRPTVVRTSQGRDAPLRGNACVDAQGVVRSTRIDLDPRDTMRGAIEVTYRPHERVDVFVPDRMWEWYLMSAGDASGFALYVETMASYSNLRRFTVTTSERVK